MNRTGETMKILARLHKTPPEDGSYFLRGELEDGREVQVFCNQRKSRPDDADFLLVEVLRHDEPRRSTTGA